MINDPHLDDSLNDVIHNQNNSTVVNNGLNV